MLIVAALGGNALSRRNESLDSEVVQRNVRGLLSHAFVKYTTHPKDIFEKPGLADSREGDPHFRLVDW